MNKGLLNFVKCLHYIYLLGDLEVTGSVDCTIGSPSILSKCVNFEVLAFDPLFSDIHCASQFSLKSNNTDTCTISEADVPINVDEPPIYNDKLGYIWDYTRK